VHAGIRRVTPDLTGVELFHVKDCKVQLTEVSYIRSDAKQQTNDQKPILTATNLALGKGLHPHEHAVERNDHDAHDPKHLRIVRLVVAEDNGEDDTTKVASCANNTGEDTFKHVSKTSVD
jgi:hypothetical protein